MDGCDITPLSITERAHLGIGYAFQQPPRFKGMKIKELLELAASGNQDNTNASDLLYEVGLCASDYLDRIVDSNLSGGEMKRLEIATVFARHLKVAIFDEPEAGIDLWSLQRLAETFRNMHARYNTTIVIISHQEKILELADEIILMTDGEIKEAAQKDKILSEIFHSDSCLYQTRCGREGWPQC
jgi:Fe-S cluster assembly ATP-binding protein